MAKSKVDVLHQHIISELKRLRKQKGLSHQKLADLAGVTRPAISFLESGKRNPSLFLCLKLCEALEVDLDEVISNKTTL